MLACIHLFCFVVAWLLPIDYFGSAASQVPNKHTISLLIVFFPVVAIYPFKIQPISLVWNTIIDWIIEFMFSWDKMTRLFLVGLALNIDIRLHKMWHLIM